MKEKTQKIALDEVAVDTVCISFETTKKTKIAIEIIVNVLYCIVLLTNCNCVVDDRT